MITVALLAILAALAAPSMNTWIRNSQVRGASDALQTGLRLAQAEASRRSRQTVFFLTNSGAPQTSPTATANGKFWAVNTVQITAQSTDLVEFIDAGVLGSEGNGVSITGPASICFSSLGRLVLNTSPGPTDADCDAASIPAVYNITSAGADRAMRVTVAVGGQIRMCDPAKTLAATTPDGCP